MLEERFSIFGTVKGTRSNHFFIPTIQGSIQISSISTVLPQVTIYLSEVGSVNDVPAGSFYACTYDKEWLVRWNSEIFTKEHNDVMVKFMQPKNLSKHYFWPSRDDESWIPIEDI